MATGLASAQGTAPASLPRPRQVWADEFNRPGRPYPANWGCEAGFAPNHEAQWYQPANARGEIDPVRVCRRQGPSH